MLETIFHGHSFVEIRNDEVCIFVDPFITGNSTCDLTVEQAIARQPQAIIVTHGHEDHVGNTVEIAKAT
jgi:L-ascorbate metabolism protein UlaG (beta-lactamase superfamily)